jgi:hypothetical protein
MHLAFRQAEVRPLRTAAIWFPFPPGRDRSDLGTFALLLRRGRWFLMLDVLYASTSPEAIELRVAVVTLHGFEGNKVTVLDAFVAVGVLTATSRAGWLWCCYYFHKVEYCAGQFDGKVLLNRGGGSGGGVAGSQR